MRRKLLSFAMAMLTGLGLCTPSLAACEPGIVGKQVVLSVGARTVALIDFQDTLWMWGRREYGMMGNGGIDDDPDSDNIQSTAVKVMEDVYSVVINSDIDEPVAAAIKKDGSLWMWGCNRVGQLGNGGGGIDYKGPYGTVRDIQPTPIKVMDDVAAVSCGGGHTAAIKKDGSLWVWGDNFCGQIGNGSVGEPQKTPVKVMDGVKAVSCNYRNTAAVKTDGSLWMWGETARNALNNGMVGNYTQVEDVGSEVFTGTLQTVPIKTMDGVSAVYYRDGDLIPYVLRTDGTLVTWPSNVGMTEDYVDEDGFVIPGSPIAPTEPLPLRTIAEDVVSVSNGSRTDTTALLKTDGSLWMFGDNYGGSLGNINVLKQDYVTSKDAVKADTYGLFKDVAAVAVGPTTVFAITVDGVPWGWGSTISDQMSIAQNISKTTKTRIWTNPLGQKIPVECIPQPLPISSIPLPKVPGEDQTPAPSAPAGGGSAGAKDSGTFTDAVLSPQKLAVDGSDIECEKYNIGGSNYFKLRDLAQLLNGTGSQFGVGFDAASSTVTITTGAAYEPTGSELATGVDNSATAQPSDQAILIDGVKHDGLTAYNIGGNNFFQLRELGNILGFEVDYDASTNTAIVHSK